MQVYAITGGKGGVGKSTFSILLANYLRRQKERLMLCDADVECPNIHLLAGVELGPRVEKVYARFPEVNVDECQKCGLCVRECRSKAFFQIPSEYPQLIPELCTGCGLCWNICPHEALRPRRRLIGEIFRKDLSKDLSLVSGRSVGVVDETGPIVSKLREVTEQKSPEKVDYLLIDTAPGMHCSVIRALMGVARAYVVTEPTPLGAHDLELILELLCKLKVPAKVVLNQADLGDRRQVDKIVADFGVEIACELPYSQEIVKAYSGGKLLDLDLLKNV